MSEVMDGNHHGLRNPERSFFKNLTLLGLVRQIGLKILGAFGVFSAELSPPTLVL